MRSASNSCSQGDGQDGMAAAQQSYMQAPAVMVAERKATGGCMASGSSKMISIEALSACEVKVALNF